VTNILLVGCGKMGGALLDGWLDRGAAPDSIIVVEPSEALRATRSVPRMVPVIDDVPAGFYPDVVVLAIKPQMMKAALPPYARYGKAVFLSIAAGKTLGGFRDVLGTDVAVVRAMPNTPAAVRRGMTVAVANRIVSAPQRDLCADLLTTVGDVEWVDDEALIDVVTAVSGSGPAYVFLLSETLAEAGAAAGLPPELAARLARATVSGSGELLRRSPESAAVLRQNVTSPGGTTFAALQVLMGEAGLADLLRRAVAAAAERSRELAN
jgi:pyrroline-5-carboxylate reductase